MIWSSSYKHHLWGQIFYRSHDPVKTRRHTLLAKITALPTDVVQPFEPWPQDKYKFVQYLSFPRYGNPSGLIGRKPNQIGFCAFQVKFGNKYFAWFTRIDVWFFRSASVGSVVPWKSANPVNRILLFSYGDKLKWRSPHVWSENWVSMGSFPFWHPSRSIDRFKKI